MNRLMTAAVTAMLLGACASEGKEAAKDGARTSEAATAGSGGASTATRDACELITTADLAAEFAPRTFIVDTSGPVPRNRVGKANQNSVTSCTFASTNSSFRDMMTITVMVVTSPSDAAQRTVEQMKTGAMSLGLKAVPVDVAGLGDGAYWVNLGSAQRSSLSINVKQGARRWLTVGESSTGQREAETVTHLTKLAGMALGKL